MEIKKSFLQEMGQPGEQLPKQCNTVYIAENPVARKASEFFLNRIVWTVEDVARELHCSIRHIRKLVSEDRIPYAKMGRLVRFHPDRVHEWLHKGGTR